jgi:type VI secretion system protein ImpL
MIQALLAALLRLRTLLAAVGLAALAALVWVVGPMVTVFGATPLGPAGTRAAVVAVLVLGTLLVAVVRILLAYRANRRMIRSLLDTEQLSAFGETATNDELERIRERFKAALRALEEASVGARGGKDFVQQFPWYVIIGPPGAGKTTILRNSGLNFPLTDQLGPDPVAGVGGTRHCDWWFTDEAVLIDTAGRYTTQDSNSEVDRAAWRGFLDLVRSHRRRRPINGVILAISLADVLTRSAEARRAHVEAIKRRLQELMRSFGMRLPVYVAVTKCDLVAGFSDFFEDLDDGGRAQIWGMTFPPDEAQNPFTRHFAGRFAELAAVLEARVMTRLAEERSVARRARIYMFPREFRTLREPFEAFFGEIFKSSRFETQPVLRGLYLTSGTQEGTPLDRIVGAMSRTFGISSGLPVPQHGKGKAYFIRRVLTDVVFEEQDLVGANRELERRLAIVQTGGTVAALAAGILVAFVWLGAYARSEADIADATNDASVLAASLQGLPERPQLAAVLPVLDQAERLRTDAAGAGLWSLVSGGGLAVAPVLGSHAERAYERVLVTTLLPSLKTWLEGRIASVARTAATPDQLSLLRELLQTYLMLGTPARLDKEWMRRDLKDEVRVALPLDASKQADLDRHLDDLVALLPQPVALDNVLVEVARSRLRQVPQSDKVYARLLREGLQNRALAPVDLGGLIGQTALQTVPDANGNRSLVVQGIFTRSGFYDFFIPRLGTIVREEIGADWVTGDGGPGDDVVEALARSVAASYVADYVQTWQAALARIGIGRFGDLQRAMIVIQALAGPQSPIERVIDAVRDNTDLPPPGQESVLADAAPAAPAPAASLQSAALSAAKSAAGSAATAAASFGDMPWPGVTIAEPFLPLIRMVTAGQGNQPPPIGQIRDQLGALYGSVAAVANAPQPPDAAFQLVVSRAKNPAGDVMGALQATSAQQPEPVRAWLRGVAAGTWRALLDLADQKVNQAWRTDVLPVCERGLFQRFPIYDGADEVALDDFKEIFKANGFIDGFYRIYLSPLVAERGSGYVPMAIDGDRLAISEAALAQFRRARQIRDAFFTAREGSLYVPFNLRPTFLSSSLLRATLNYDGKEIVYRHEAPRDTALAWPSDSGSSRVSVTLAAVDGKNSTVTQSGPWALFRLIAASGASGSRGNAGFSFSIADADKGSVTYELRAASVNNPFNLGLLRAFRCPEEL